MKKEKSFLSGSSAIHLAKCCWNCLLESWSREKSLPRADAENCGRKPAAPQVGLLRRIVVIDVGEGRIELINPEIIKTSGEQDGAEGCLSFPGEFGMVKRPMNVTVRAQDRNGKTFEISGTELLARAFCHEIDHLNGVCFVTRASRMLEPDELES